MSKGNFSNWFNHKNSNNLFRRN